MRDRSNEKYEQQKAASRDWKKRNKERHAELARAYRARNKEKTKAQNKLNYAIRKGKVIRGACEKCGTTDKVNGHHHDYNKPYDVEWLCQPCHKLHHHSGENLTEDHKRVKFAEAKPAVLFGEDNPNAKLTKKDVSQIKALLATGEYSQTKIGKMFGVGQTLISSIKRSKSWLDIE